MYKKTLEEFKKEKEVIEKERKERIQREKEQKEKATEYVENFRKKGNKYIAIRIRNGFIGKELTADGRILQPYRTKPRGTIVAFKDPENENILRIGISYLNGYKDKDIPIVGIAESIKYALEENKDYVSITLSKPEDKIRSYEFINKDSYDMMSKNDKELLDFFRIRALCYFYPDLYSHSRGSEKIEYPNYEKIHKNIKRVLGN